MLELVRDAARLMDESEEFIGKVKESWIPSSVFGSDTKSVGCPYMVSMTSS